MYFNLLLTVPGQNNTRFTDVYLKRFKRFSQKIDRENVVQNILFTKRVCERKIKTFKSEVVPNIHRPTKKTKYILTCISVLKPVNTCSCFGRVINDFGKLFSAPPYEVTLKIKIFRFAPKINFNCCGFFKTLPLTLLQSTSLAAVVDFSQIQPRILDIHSRPQHLVNIIQRTVVCSKFHYFTDISQALVTGTDCVHE